MVANKIDIDPRVTNKEFKFAKRQGLPFEFASAADGTNIVKLFDQAIELAEAYKGEEGNDFIADVQKFMDEESPLERAEAKGDSKEDDAA